jgi:hypothetical protein
MPRGRPKGEVYPVLKQFRMGERHREMLREMMEAWGCKEAAAIRRCIEETYENRRRVLTSGGAG